MRSDLGLGVTSAAVLAQRGGGGIVPPPGPPAGFDYVVLAGEQVTQSGDSVIARTGA